MKVIIVTTDKTLLKWRSLNAKLADIQDTLGTIKNEAFEPIETVYHTLAPHVERGRITHDWMDAFSAPYWKAGYDFVILHMSRAQRKQFGIQTTLNGLHHVDFDPVSEMYVMADEDNKRGKFNHFVQTTLHELRHAICRGTRVTDDTHTLHASGADIRPHFASLDMRRYDPTWHNIQKQLSLYERVVQLKRQLMSQQPTLYQVCLKALGTDASPRDLASDVVGCAESVSEIIRQVIPNFPRYTGTATLQEKLAAHPRFQEVSLPMPGTIIISPSGMKRPYPGHVGIFGEGEKIMSNTSANGKFEQNYTLTSWRKRWGAFPTFYYQLIN